MNRVTDIAVFVAAVLSLLLALAVLIKVVVGLLALVLAAFVIGAAMFMSPTFVRLMNWLDGKLSRFRV
jgi:uncharacterized membrane-anchored protein